MASWRFYGRKPELSELGAVLARDRWSFAKVTGRRRIGKTSLIRQAAPRGKPFFYVQIPDTDPAGVVQKFRSALLALDVERQPPPSSLEECAALVGRLSRSGYLVVLDEFQYFQRQSLRAFQSMLQAEVDALASPDERVTGGLLVSGSIQTEVEEILNNRVAPLFGRVTSEFSLGHLDLSSIAEILHDHAVATPERLLFFWSLFEGVPKFYRDCYDLGVLSEGRRIALRRLFFEGSSPLKTEAESWFLKEFRGRYDVILKYVAEHEGCTAGELTAHVRSLSAGQERQTGSYLISLAEKHRLIRRALPVFANRGAKSGRYYLEDNFLAAWLAALESQVQAVHFRDVNTLVDKADKLLEAVEGYALEKMVRQLYRERSRLNLGDFNLTHEVSGYWDSKDTEIDLVFVDEDSRRIRFGTCKRNPQKLIEAGADLIRAAERFLVAKPRYASWQREYVAVAPAIPRTVRAVLARQSILAQDLRDLIPGLQ